MDKGIARYRQLYLLVAITIILLGFGIRLHNLGGDSLWLDEQLTLKTAALGFPEVLTGAKDHPPLIYFLTFLSIHQFGETEFAARLVSLFAGTLAIPLIILFGLVLRRPGAGLWAALFLSFSPLHLKYAQESRHYALLMAVSLLTYILLYQALLRPKAKYWIPFAAATALNLYIHYGAFIVLGSQVVLILFWMLWQLKKGSYKLISYPLLAAAITILLYLPWLPNFLASLDRNVGASTISDTGGIAPISQWLREAFSAFGMYYDYWPGAILSLAVLGLLILILHRDGWTIALLATGMVLPFLLIQAGFVARAPFARYIIYVLPLYLFAAAVTPATILAYLNSRAGPKVAVPATIISALLFVSFAWEPVRSEHIHIQDDWRGIVEYLDQNASAGDIIVALSMNFGSGFNTVSDSMPYYLDKQSAKEYTLLPANRLRHSNMDSLQGKDGEVWIVFYDNQFNRESYVAHGLNPKRFQTHLYVMPNPHREGSLLDQIIWVYEKMIPFAGQPSPNCLLLKDLALLYRESGNLAAAEDLLFEALANCNDDLVGEYFAYDLQTDVQRLIFEEAAQHYLENTDYDNAARLAGALYRLDPHNAVANDVLTVFDLFAAYKRGDALVEDSGSIEPVTTMQFVMPQSGDYGDALLIHPPASVSYQLDLPQEPLILISRVAMAPPSWDWGGDGSTFTVTVTTADGEVFEIFSLHVSNQAEDRRWHNVEVPLTQFAGKKVTLTLKSDPGPAGDFSGDWAGWESPRIMTFSP